MEEVPTGDWFCDECGEAAERSGAISTTSNSGDESFPGEAPGAIRGSERVGVNVEASSTMRRNLGKGEHAMEGPGQRDGRLQARLLGSKAGGGQPSPKRCEKGGNRQSKFVIGGPPKCQAQGCDKRAYYRSGQHPKGVPQFCNQHKTTAMVRKPGIFCEVLGCTSQATYAFLGQKRVMRCGKHKEPRMVRVHHVCQAPGCLTEATYRVRSGRKATRCVAHKSEGMSPYNKLREQAGCPTQASFNYPGQARSFCSQHAQEGMVAYRGMKA